MQNFITHNPQLIRINPYELRRNVRSNSDALLRQSKQQPVDDELPLTEQIPATARQLFQNNGFDHTSLADLCKEMNIDRATFYRHYGSLHNVLEILWNR